MKDESRKRIIFVCIVLSICFLISCNRGSESSGNVSGDPKFTQYYNQGELLYQKNCANCHQMNGKGLGRLYPPLDSSDFLSKNFEDVICIMRYGRKGELVVNGVSFNQPMPGIPSLTDLELASIATYVYNSWSNKRGIVDVTEVTSLQKNCKSEYTGSRN